MNLVLTYLTGRRAGEQVVVADADFFIGRDPAECRLCFDDQEQGVSRRHAKVTWQNGVLTIADVGSTYGTFVNGQQIQGPMLLGVGAIIQLGKGGPCLRVERFDAAPEAAPLPPVQAAPARPSPSVTGSNLGADFGKADPEKTNGGWSWPQRPDAGPAMTKPYLELLNAGVPRRIVLTEPVITIGHDQGNTIALDQRQFPTVSRQHAIIERQGDTYFIRDLGSFNGTLVNGYRIAAPAPLQPGALIEIGVGGAQFRFVAPETAPVVSSTGEHTVSLASSRGVRLATPQKATEARNFVTRKHFAQGKTPGRLTVGRAPENDIQLDLLQISKQHAVFGRDALGWTLEDLKSTNGVYVNGRRITRCRLRATDVIQIGPFLFRLEPEGIAVFDTRSRARIDVFDLTREVPNRHGTGTVRLLDRVRLSIPANEFVGLLGPSGAGKSTLMDALNGMRPAEQGVVLVNGLNLYENIDCFKQSIGYVPQDDIIHRELTVERTLYYVARMRLSSDTSDEEIERILTEVLDVTGLTTRRKVPVGQLSGGQRKRVSIAVELVTQPGIIFLDEPTSGLDPATEEKIMHLFRQIASGGHSVILTTHAMENVRLFDKIVVLMRGRLVWFGPPSEALAYFGITSIKELFDTLGDPNSDEVAIGWQRKYEQSDAYRKYVHEPLAELARKPLASKRPAKSRLTFLRSLDQMLVLSARYARVMLADRLNLAILFGQAPIIALLTGLAVGHDWARDFPYFVLALSAIWFGCSNAAREIVKEMSIYRRERMVNLGIVPYVGSKLVVLTLVGLVQVVLLYGVMAAVESVPGSPLLVLPYLMLSHLVGIAMGLLISALVQTSEMATSLVPLVLIPQILFGGLLLPNEGMAKGVSLVMPAMWSYDALKRIGVRQGGLGVLRGVGGEDDPSGEIGRIKQQNQQAIDDFKEQLEAYRKRQQQRLDEYKNDLEGFLRTGGVRPEMPKPEKAPEAPRIEYPPEDKSRFVGFLNDFGSLLLDVGVLMGMFLTLLFLTMLVLRSKDILG
jgi:ABC-type multidrug transport system ATPase subunit/pSer/pThr/pTyr-binding forkhead associated (FHA) protein